MARKRYTYIDIEKQIQECRRCKEIKSFTEFHKKNGMVSGIDSMCKFCDNLRRKESYVNPESSYYKSQKQNRLNNSSKNIEYQKQYRETNKDNLLAKRREKVLHKKELDRVYVQKFPEKIAAKSARRRAYRLQATPDWANRKYIDLFYEIAQIESKELGEVCHVDHIVPLKSKLVCGLHNEFNLQVLLGEENLQKSNVTWPDMP